MDDNRISNLIITLSSLYELLLNVGNSFDVQESAEAFLKKLMAQKNLSFAAYYNYENKNTLVKVHSIPKTRVQQYEIDGGLQEIFIHDQFSILDKTHPYFQFMTNLTGMPAKEYVVYYTGLKSVILLGRKKSSFIRQDIITWEMVLNKFGRFMESLQSHHRIKDEIRIKEEQAKIIEQNNEKLKKQNDDLLNYIRSNDELEQFAYRASHDLNAPLITIIEFSKMLAAQTEGALSEKQSLLLKYILESGLQMRSLVNGILDYSKITGTTLNLKNINLYESIETIRNLLYHSLNETKGEIIVKSSPEFIVADDTKITQLFLNLISNALKFRKEDVNPQILIKGERNDKEYKFSIGDNGIGIPIKNQEKIFELFSKVQRKGKIEGHGIGLNTCRQIIEQHKGKIWLESKPSEGTTFHFTISRMKLPASTKA